jgi:hypothetical protein
LNFRSDVLWQKGTRHKTLRQYHPGLSCLINSNLPLKIEFGCEVGVFHLRSWQWVVKLSVGNWPIGWGWWWRGGTCMQRPLPTLLLEAKSHQGPQLNHIHKRVTSSTWEGRSSKSRNLCVISIPTFMGGHPWNPFKCFPNHPLSSGMHYRGAERRPPILEMICGSNNQCQNIW